jgi:GT2 family glycosyltransferase
MPSHTTPASSTVGIGRITILNGWVGQSGRIGESWGAWELRILFSSMFRPYLLITTHTTLHLERTLRGVCMQSLPPAELVISCDNNKPELAHEAHRCAAALGLRGTLVMREHMQVCRLSQVINNGVRAMQALPGTRALHPDDRIIIIQGDCCPGRDFVRTHMELGKRGDLVVGFRHDITSEQTDRFDDVALAQGRDPVGLTAAQVASIQERHQRLVWQARLRPFGLAKSHKPKVLGADFSVRAQAFEKINGMDEEYVGYGSEDDDVGRRLYASGASVAVGIQQLEIYHLWHQTRKGQDWEASSGVARFKMKTPTRAVHGLDNPLPQRPVEISSLGAGILQAVLT